MLNIAPLRPQETNEACRIFLQFIKTLREFRGDALCIDMSKASTFVATGTLLLKAELAYLKARGVRLSGIPSKKEKATQVLTQTGIADLLNLPLCKKVDREDTVHWRYAAGDWRRAQPERVAGLLLSEDELYGSSLYRGLIESVANSIEHAYKEHPERRIFYENQDGWWGFQQYRDGVLTTCICDLGIGIANALPIKLASEPTMLNKLLALYRRHKGRDVQSILASIEYGRSSAQGDARGKGMRDAHRVIDEAGEGQLALISNRGFYFYQVEKRGAKPHVGTKRLPISINGTIYVWKFPLQLTSVPSSLLGQGEMT